jgi:L-amino acid N-acyltransferase YncA
MPQFIPADRAAGRTTCRPFSFEGEVNKREKLGAMDGRWRDVMLLERRSKIAGV